MNANQKLKTMAQKIEQLKTTDLIPYAGNTRTHDEKQVAQVAASIKEFGFTNPILVDGENGIIAGHGRLMAAQKLGMETVPCLRLGHLTDAQRRAYIIADNKLALNAGWDEDALAVEIERLLEDGFDLDLTGFGEDEISDFLKDETEGLTDEDEVPEVAGEVVSIAGDIWLLGDHRLMCGDSTSIDAVEKLMAGQKADMLHTDPPYGVDYEGVPNDDLKDAQLEAFLTDALSAAFKVLNEGSNVYVWHADITAFEFISAFRSVGFKQARPPTIQWVKPSLTMSQGDYHSKNEPCLYGWKEGSGRVRVKDRTQTTVWEIDRTKENKVHPTMKPVELCERAIENSSKTNSLVLDLFGGSGSTLIACEKTNRKCCMMELDSKYCDVIVKRWQEFTGKQATNETTGKTFADTEAKMKGELIDG